MEVIILLLLIVLIVLYNNSQSSNGQTIRKLTEEVGRLAYEVRSLKENLQQKEAPRVNPTLSPDQPEAKPVSVAPPRLPQRIIPVPKEQNVQHPHTQTESTKIFPPEEPKDTWWQRWMKNNPDWEKFIGENLVNKIGIAVLVLGIAFFVKYAIDQNWINEVGRVSIGLGCGALLIGIAHYLRKSYRSFSSVLAGGGIAVFYFTIAFAFHQYHLLSQTAAFAIMAIITAFAVALSLLYDKLELAVIAAVGGFMTPFLLSTGEGNYVVLLTYLIILNGGLLSLSYFKRWPAVNILALLFTEAIVAGWMIRTLIVYAQPVSYTLALGLITILYFLFLSMNMIHQLRSRQAFKALDFSVLLLITASYYAAGMTLLHFVLDGAYQGLFTLGSGVVNLGLAWFFFKRKGTDRNLLYLLIGLTLTFLSLTVPVQLHGHTITLFWSAEFVLLYWLYLRSGIRLFRHSAALISILTIISLLMDWQAAASTATSSLLLIYTNLRGLITNIVAIAAFAAYGWLLSQPRERDEDALEAGTSRKFAFGLAFLIAYCTAVFGVNLYFNSDTTYEVANAYHRLITEIFALLIIGWLQWRRSSNYQWLQLTAAGCYFLFYLVSQSFILDLRNSVLQKEAIGAHLAAHWVSGLLFLYVAYVIISIIRKHISIFEQHSVLFAWTISALLVLFFSLEAQHAFVVAGYNGTNLPFLEAQYAKAILTILWALCSFVLMWLGMRHKVKTLRLISLSLFSLALLKLFFWDIRNVSEGGKIAAFILLGALLLTISFMYQKLKKMIIDEEKI